MKPPRTLHELLSSRREELIERVNRTLKDLITSRSMPRAELQDSLPLFLDQIIEALERAASGRPSSPPPEARSTAMEHGEHRLRLGFSVEAVVRDYDILREAVLDLADEEGVTPNRGESRAVAQVIDAATFEAVREYQRQRDEAQRRLADEHLSFLAHELRNPLSSARTALALLRRTAIAPGVRAADVLDRNLATLSGLIDEALIGRQVQAGVRAQREVVALPELLAAVRAESEVDAQAKDLAVTIDADAGLEVEADARLLRSVVTNLLRNAVKFSHRGGAVRLGAHLVEGRIVVDVEDSCGGLDPTFMNKLFDPFVQANKDRSGFGLGLAIARQAAEAHAGTLEVHNLPGRGCVFFLSLPRTAEAAPR